MSGTILAEHLNSQFSFWQNIEFFARLIAACACGALIGIERSRRFKEAGIRTHLIVCCASALMMIVSKYGFVDIVDASGALLNGVRGSDGSRIAAQVVSGISFLGAGVIFKHGNSIKGLTTAAGLWATAGIGLAIGAGMYILGAFTTALVTILQIVMHKFVVGADTLSVCRLSFTVYNGSGLQAAWNDFVQLSSVATRLPFSSTSTGCRSSNAAFDTTRMGMSAMTRPFAPCVRSPSKSWMLSSKDMGKSAMSAARVWVEASAVHVLTLLGMSDRGRARCRLTRRMCHRSISSYLRRMRSVRPSRLAWPQISVK